jgi:hypothetical protein
VILHAPVRRYATPAAHEPRHARSLPFPRGTWMADVANRRGCGCTVDYVVFGHRDCHRDLHGCPCRECGCACHRRAAA